MGIAAMIIAFYKRRTTYGIILAVWNAAAIATLILTKFGFALFPGALFLFIAIRMESYRLSKLPKDTKNTNSKICAFCGKNYNKDLAVCPWCNNRMAYTPSALYQIDTVEQNPKKPSIGSDNKGIKETPEEK